MKGGFGDLKTLNTNIAKIRDKNNNWSSIPALRGESAYELAVKKGFEGSEDDFNNSLVKKEEIDKISETLKGKLNVPLNPLVGKYLRVKAVNEDGVPELEWVDEPSGGSSLDIQIDGQSIVKDGVAEIPLCTKTKDPGLVTIDLYSSNGGLYRANYNTGLIRVAKANNMSLTERNNEFCPVVPANLDYAVKCAMCDGKGAAWTSEEQANARKRMGAESSDWELACDVTLEEDSDNVIIQLNGNYSEIYGIFKFPTVPSGECRMFFYDKNNSAWNEIQGAFCQNVSANEMVYIHSGIHDGIAMFEHHSQTQNLAPYPSAVSRTTKECKDALINAFATFAFTSPLGTNFKIWGRKL